jgi:hypothetical protein
MIRTAARSADLAELRFARLVERFHRLGARTHCEFLRELGAERLIRHVIEQKLERYLERLDPEVLRALGADQFPTTPIHLVHQGEEQ